ILLFSFNVKSYASAAGAEHEASSSDLVGAPTERAEATRTATGSACDPSRATPDAGPRCAARPQEARHHRRRRRRRPCRHRLRLEPPLGPLGLRFARSEEILRALRPIRWRPALK